MFRLDNGALLVQTVDFFTPIVDDPEAFGAIAAANALSDVYAMGGRPVTALSIAAIPTKDFPAEWTAAIFRGGASKLKEAGCALLGGHTIRDPEVKFGYAITGLVEERDLLTNAGARPGHAIVLTKPIGTGVIGTALKNDRAPQESVRAATESMTRLNRAAAEAARRHAATAATDVTGFGLAGHALGVARESRVTIELDLAALPLLPGAFDLAEGNKSTGLRSNEKQYAPLVDEEGTIDPALRSLFYDPQTSGGLLIALDPSAADALVKDFEGARRIGSVVEGEVGRVRIRA